MAVVGGRTAEEAGLIGASGEGHLLHVPAIVHGRCLLDAPTGASALLVGFHGHGEIADDGLAALRRVRGGHPWALAAVQALHPFYRRDGSIAAGWMTRQDRELALADNVAYAQRAIARVREETGVARLALLGFSQGVAMAYRAAAVAGGARALVALAGDVPPELHDRELPGFPPVLLGRGSEEEWYSEEKLAADLAVLERLGVAATVHRYVGGHLWHDDFVAVAREFLAAHLA